MKDRQTIGNVCLNLNNTRLKSCDTGTVYFTVQYKFPPLFDLTSSASSATGEKIA
jgi:hypothetical protein